MTTSNATNSLIEDLRWRGLLNQTTDENGIAELLNSGPQTIYIGFDPTATSLHVGGMMQLMMLRRFQRAGHNPIALVGGATGMIGDPSGKSEERNLLSADQLQKNVDGVAAQMRHFLDFEGENAAKLLNNFDWMKDYSYLEFLRDVGKNFPVGAMMGKESVRSRLESEAGLSYTEFSYMLLQAYDFVNLAKTHDCRIQAGGSDQWGNITAGIDLGRRMLGKQLFGITAPLLTTSDGRKMGKTESGAVWLDPERTSPYAFYQYWINVADEDVMRCLAYLTEIERAEYDELEDKTKNDPGQRTAQKRLAQWLTELVHGEAGVQSAQRATQILFGGELGDTTDSQLREIFADVPSCDVPKSALEGEGLWIVEALQTAKLCNSGGDARRALSEGGVYVNNTRVEDVQKRLTVDDLDGRSVLVLRRGKRKYALLKIQD
ncbi:tyrosine--tRNA ligase [Rhodopirellula europaea]|uniref:Tyrosine--tRNA ligase n=2 Tax=Rhodopirellula europaea TaxID=1263866 RepID=M5S0Y1_9BACT|nr:tyrosine--tRNA ligase [Rhodopirellula europaea]EMB13997.1 tyrosyl-tRNA synthetase [Rhodopirellula europaea 6C]EMI25131.1 tyrosyl-tRNA synthetase [Rhodopirellula europaea SH398]